MNPQDPNQPAPVQSQQSQQPPQPVQVNNPLSVMQSGEQNICEIRRHPIGLVGVYISSAFVLIIIAILAYGIGPHFITNYSSGQIEEIGTIVLLAVAALMLVYLFIANIVYWGNRWVLTTDSLTQVLQRSLFDRQSSQLSLGNLEDVTAQQDGVLAHMFNFGTLRVETAGERSKFVLMFCPKPNFYAQEILRARENFEQNRRGNDDQRNYRGEGSYSPPPNGGVNLNTEA